MTEAPNRIWLDWPGANKGEPVYDEPPERDTQTARTEYIRGDVHAAEVSRLRGALDNVAKSLGWAVFFLESNGVTKHEFVKAVDDARAAFNAKP